MIKEARRLEAVPGIIIGEFLMNDVEAFRVMHDTCWNSNSKSKSNSNSNRNSNSNTTQSGLIKPYKVTICSGEQSLLTVMHNESLLRL